MLETYRQLAREYAQGSSDRPSHKIVELGRQILADRRDESLPEAERLQLYEILTEAALDLADWEISEQCLERLLARFPQSNRVKRLQARTLEAQGKYEQADKIYQQCLQQDETDMAAAKHRIGILLAKQKRPEAITALLGYLDTFSQDLEGWAQLSQLYEQEFLYGPAAFCMEEIILNDPFNYTHHLRLAEILYTMNKIRLALKHYCRVLELNADCLRAMYGVKLCISRLRSGKEGGEEEEEGEKTWKALDLKITDKLLRMYAKNIREGSGGILKAVEGWLS